MPEIIENHKGITIMIISQYIHQKLSIIAELSITQHRRTVSALDAFPLPVPSEFARMYAK